MPKALVTGGTGFVGSNLVEGLNASGIDVRVAHRASSSLMALKGLEYESVTLDISDDVAAIEMAAKGCDWVFHTAAISDYWRHKSDVLYRVNVEGTKNVLAAAERQGVSRFIFTSSIIALGLPEPGKQLDESSQFNLDPARFPYADSKHLAEVAVLQAVDRGFPAVILNLPIVIGPRDLNQVSGSIIVEAAKGRLRFFFPGGANFVAVEDVVAGHIAALGADVAERRYIIAGENLTFTQAIETICRLVGRPRPKFSLPAPALPAIAGAIDLARRLMGTRIPIDANQVRISGQFIFADGSKAARDLKIRRTPFETAVGKAYEWYKGHGIL